jgi:predicted AlkP superfamily phosphohydrolase/phosphomutase
MGRVMILGLDGVPWQILNKWVEEGILPNIGKLRDKSSTAGLRSSIQPLTAPAWSSFMTGKNPGQHDIFDFVRAKPDSYQFTYSNTKQLRSKTFWELLSDQGKRVCVVNVPCTYPVREVNGYWVSGLMTPTLASEFTHPKEFKNEVLDIMPEYHLNMETAYSSDDKAVRAYIADIEKMTADNTTLALHLLKKETWDVFTYVIYGTDPALHYFWKYIDEDHPQYKKEEADKYGPLLKNFYRKVDSYVGQVLEFADKDTTVMMMSDHGMGPLYGAFNVNVWLKKKGYLVLKKNAQSRVRSTLFNLGMNPRNIYKGLTKVGLGWLAWKLPKNLRNKALKSTTLSFQDVDWSKTTAYSIGHFGNIVINLKGRQPQGIVEPGEECETLKKKIAADLETVELPTGKTAKMSITYNEDIYSGPYVANGPDITFNVNNYTYDTSYHFEFGSNKIFSEHLVSQSATHRREGIFLISGPQIKKGEDLGTQDITDVAPTALHVAGCPVPEDMDGKVISTAFTGDLALAKVKTSKSKKEEKEDEFYSAEEEERVRARLEALGYLK